MRASCVAINVAFSCRVDTCSGPQSSRGWPANKSTGRPTFAANTRDVGPTIAANETTLLANSPQTGLWDHIICKKPKTFTYQRVQSPRSDEYDRAGGHG